MSSTPENDLVLPIRRIVTTHTPAGKAVFASDDILTPLDPATYPNFSAPTAQSGFGVIQIHRTRGFPVDNTRPLTEYHGTKVPLADTKGPSARIIDVPAGNTPFPHRTVSLDYIVVLKGEIYLQLDDGEEKLCKENDIIVVRGGTHAWVNRGTGVARLFGVVVPSQVIVTETGEKLTKTELGDVFDPKEEND